MSHERQKGVVVSKAIAYGSVAMYLGRKSEETKTHRWHIYVRGLAGEDLSYMISKVVISLHNSFANPVRVLTEPPYEVSEYGWGEFETKIQIHFQDPDEKPVDIIHMLILYPPGNQIASTKKPVVSEFYDELVFNEPSELMYKKLMAGPEKQAPPNALQEHWPVYNEIHDLQLLTDAQATLAQELALTKKLLMEADIEAKEIKEKIAAFEAQKKLEAKAKAAATS
ncbi:hypothetical protein SDRG_16997 [Saprolegnia diclina VS20]|uniref:YEATS domain-containing protein n=1 Tax=Saprolegnia diclina (strain VS20) TaxID=1156394 RepID=T0QZD8_SAPDV|nr:hypothetical protein SDRG_16997 [Saprolegnia diclina VS20]EQC25118.1 hypothetical protein SDRG_16997 [Saprolegnia diclina VS20]|eukprot:XP_008621452.1 hypothetical protein SDRG_16997 [Saprolegnia diclina VS20]